MRRCPITYEAITDESRYSAQGLRLFAPSLRELKIFAYDKDEQIREAAAQADKMSIQGVQPKISVVLNIKNASFDIVDTGGTFIVKPPHMLYPSLPENEDVTMKMAREVGISVPPHGLIEAKDGTYSYVIKRFDRQPRGRKVHTEDFAQLSEKKRDEKYSSSMEKVAEVIDSYCSFPAVEKEALFVRVLFSFLTGNEDMHLKNFSLIVQDGVRTLTPAYDLLNTTVAMGGAKEELALPLNGKKSKLMTDDFFVYYAKERLMLSDKIIASVKERFMAVRAEWESLLRRSFLSLETQEHYLSLMHERFERIGV